MRIISRAGAGGGYLGSPGLAGTESVGIEPMCGAEVGRDRLVSRSIAQHATHCSLAAQGRSKYSTGLMLCSSRCQISILIGAFQSATPALPMHHRRQLSSEREDGEVLWARSSSATPGPCQAWYPLQSRGRESENMRGWRSPPPTIPGVGGKREQHKDRNRLIYSPLMDEWP